MMWMCHADIEDEMTSGENDVHRDLTCAMCHRTWIYLGSPEVVSIKLRYRKSDLYELPLAMPGHQR